MGFSRFELPPDLFKAVTSLGYAEPTPVQAHVIPEALKGNDIRACAQTGTGKTCAFVIPALAKLMRQNKNIGVSVLILAPTRELAKQVHAVVTSLTVHTRIKSALVVGGESTNRQTKQIRAGAEIVVATPGRLQDLIKQNQLSLKSIHTFILDEADRMLDIGFLPDIRRIFSMLSGRQQTMLFSATFPPMVSQLVRQFLKNPVYVDLAPSAPSKNVTQVIYPVSADQKSALLQAILEVTNIFSAIIFCRTKRGASKLGQTLQHLGKSVAVIHSDKTQSQRAMALQGFKELKFQILVATDIAARGIDVKDISHVINYNVPEKPEDYVHRIGRTGRAEAIGDAFTLVSPDEERYLKQIERFIQKPLPRAVIPDFPYSSRPNILSTTKPDHAKPHHAKPHHAKPNRPHKPHHEERPQQQFHKRHEQSAHSHRPSEHPHKEQPGSSHHRPATPRPHDNRPNRFEKKSFHAPHRSDSAPRQFDKRHGQPAYRHDSRPRHSDNRQGQPAGRPDSRPQPENKNLEGSWWKQKSHPDQHQPQNFSAEKPFGEKPKHPSERGFFKKNKHPKRPPFKNRFERPWHHK